MAVPTTRGEGAVVVALRSASGAAMSAADREAMLADVRGNAGSTARLTMTIHGYVQGAPGQAPNALAVRVREGGLRAMARSYRGLPFLRDHVEGDVSARGGTIVASDLIDLADGMKAIAQEIELVKPWAIEGVLDGTIDRFSTSFQLADGVASCTICGDEYMSTWFGICPACEHEPGQMYANKAGVQQCCEVEFENAIGRETSGVSVPAVQRTGIQSISAALAGGDPHQLLVRLAGELGVESADLARHLGLKEIRMSKLAPILIALSLSADADEGAALAGVEKLKLERDGLAAKLSEATAREAARLATQEAADKVAKTARIAALQASSLAEGRYVAGGAVATHVATLAQAGDEAGLTAYLADMPKGGAVPIGVALQAAGADPNAKAGQAQLTANQKKRAAEMGVSEEAYAKKLAQFNGGAQ